MQAHHAAISQSQKLWTVNNMPDQISVNFIVVDEYDNEFNSYCSELGKISEPDLSKLLTAISDSAKNIKPNSCIQTFELSYNDRITIGRTPFAAERNRALEISNLFYFGGTKPKCITCTNTKGMTEEDKMETCRKNLMAGKCTDEFIRNTLGVTFFPEHYAKQNGKQK